MLQRLLYIVLFLHQTTTRLISKRISACCISYYSYIKPQLLFLPISGAVVVYRTIPTSNHNSRADNNDFNKLYIVLFLHQTTTCRWQNDVYTGCISYYSYIKPQRCFLLVHILLSCISYYSYIKPQPIMLI